MNTRAIPKLVAVGAIGVSLGAGIGVIGNALASNGPPTSSGPAGPGGHRRGHMRLFRGVVHADLIVAQRDGRFVPVTVDRGIIESVTGNDLVLKEGTKTATYKTLRLSVPAGARVRDNRRPAAIADLKVGQRAIVIRGPQQTNVRAFDPQTGQGVPGA